MDEQKMKRKSTNSSQPGAKESRKGKTPSTYYGDPRLVSRIEQYLHDNRHSKINLTAMANHLQKYYRDYSRKKQIPFRLSVEKAYQFIVDEIGVKGEGIDCQNSTAKRRKKCDGQKGSDSDSDCSMSKNDDSDSFSSDVEKYKVYENKNSMNNALSDLYRKTPLKEPKDQSEPLPFFIDKSGAKDKVDSIHNTTEIKDAQLSDLSRDVLTPVIKKSNIARDSTAKKSTKKKESSRGEVKKNIILPKKSSVTFSDIGGNEKTLSEVCKLLVHIKHTEVYTKLGVTPPRGILLHGPPGCGKSLLAQAIAGELDVPLIKLAATEIVSGVSGESEEKLRDVFSQAISSAPCILFLDEIDAITPKRENASKDMERRIVSQLLTSMDDMNNDSSANVLVIGATNRPDALDPALRRAGRFDREISLGIPDEGARERILRVLCRNLRLDKDFDFRLLAHQSPGFVGADLNSLVREAAMTAVNRILEKVQSGSTASMESSECEAIPESSVGSCGNLSKEELSVNLVMSWLKDKPPLSDEELESLYVTVEDFLVALKHVQPSAKREGFATIPDVSWDDIGALSDVREELTLSILAPVRHQAQFARLGMKTPPGILLCGAPGCGKTLLAKAIANESGVNFISVKGPELLNMYVGESERAVRQVFQRGRNSAPCVIFFDEIDALCPKRSQSGDSGSGARVVNQLLTEMDGLEERKQVFIMAATNRPDIIDPAVLRPGRLDKILFVDLPSANDRVDILKAITKNGSQPPLQDVCLETIGRDSRCTGFTGADLSALVREASVASLKEFINSSGITNSSDSSSSQGDKELYVTSSHFDIAFGKVKPSVSGKDQDFYKTMRERLAVSN